jgi:Domain of unknown function (DUF1803).
MNRLITTNQELAALIGSEFFTQLLKMISQEPPTLRHIKQELGEKAEKQLAVLIKKGLIVRENRRYFSGIQQVMLASETSTSWVARLLDDLQTAAPEDKASILEQLIGEDTVDTVYAIAEQTPIAFRQTVSNGEMTVTSISLSQHNTTLPGYFAMLDETTVAYRLLGDVNIPYYLDQVQVVLEKILAQRRRIRESIFVQSMRMFQLIDEDLQLRVPVKGQAVTVPLIDEFQQLPLIQRQLIIGAVMEQIAVSEASVIYFSLAE